MEDQNNENITTNIYTATTTPIYATMPTSYICADPATINGDLYRDVVGINGWGGISIDTPIGINYTPPDGYECGNDPGTTFTRQHTYTTIKIWDEERIKALEERIEQIEEALMIESAKNLDSLIENDRGGEE